MDSVYEIRNMIIQPINEENEISVNSLATLISRNLGEPNMELIYEIISTLGKVKTIQYYNQTRIIEEQGGLFCKDGTRRKKPGGVFFYLIYHDSSIAEYIKRIFSDEARKKYKLKKTQIKERRIKHNIKLKERLIKEGLLVISNDQL